MADTTTPAPAQIQMPDLATWQKALPYIFAGITAIMAAAATGNWIISGPEALKDFWNAATTLGLSGGTLAGLFVTGISAVRNNSKTTGLMQRLQADLQGLKSKVAGVNPDDLKTFLDSLQAGTNSQTTTNPAIPTLSLPGVTLTLDPDVFGKPDSDARKRLITSFEAFLANLEPKPAATP